ncbi:hypothetical protein [Bacillus coahuilensis]|uniref:hypothetical protein n=1 Tax=Bacillus coahuilensis TaxID=408580 RepID=UPI0007519F62|nr:hypothetical protein [Bacillus coahuilensis]
MNTDRSYPEFTWSLSRHKTLMSCERKYAYSYYFSHKGWMKDRSQLTQDAYRLKKITNLEMYLGSVLHDMIDFSMTQYIKQRITPNETGWMEHLRTKLNRAYVDSVRHKRAWYDAPTKFTMLHEIYYEQELDRDKVQEINQRIDQCV